MDPILIVDDEKDNLDALQRLLRGQYSVTTTVSPFEALKLIQKETYHVIVSDQRMPEMLGVELLEKVKNVTPLTTRILLTGYTDVESVIGAINRGHIYRYIAKPWDPEELKLTLRQANETYTLRREVEQKNEALLKGNQELKNALQGLRLLDRAKARFLSLVSHELNTPLTVLNVFLSLLVEKRGSLSPELQKAVAALSEAGGRLSTIVAEVLTYVRLEAENQIHRERFDLRSEMRQIQKGLERETKKKGVRLLIEGSEKAPVLCDPAKMRVALKKLLEDSILRSPPSELVRITFEATATETICRLERKGQPLSVESFAPLESPGNILHHQRDLGLSLAIFKLIVESHGGKVEAKSNGTTTISFRLALS